MSGETCPPLDKRMKTTFMNHEEFKLQQICFRWFSENFSDKGAVYNSLGMDVITSVTRAMRAKSIGYKSGIPDAVLYYNEKTYFIEFKNPNGKGKLSKNQILTHAELRKQGFEVFVVNSFENFKQIIISKLI